MTGAGSGWRESASFEVCEKQKGQACAIPPSETWLLAGVNYPGRLEVIVFVAMA